MEKRIKQITSPKASKKTSWIMNKNIYCLKKDDLKISNNHNFFPLIQQWPYGLVASVSFCEFRSRGQIQLIKLGQNLYIYIYISFPSLPKSVHYQSESLIFKPCVEGIKCLIQMNILSGNVMTNSMQATSSKADSAQYNPYRKH